MKTNLLLLITFLAMLGPGCATNREKIESSNSEISAYRTFAVAEMPTAGPASDPGATARLGDSARVAIANALTEKGYVQAPPDQADLIVKVVGEFLPDPVSASSERRILTVNIIERASQDRLWSVTRSRSAKQAYTPEELTSAIQRMLEPVPLQALRQPK